MTTMNREEQRVAREKNDKLDKMLLLAVSTGPCTTPTLSRMFREPVKRIGRRFQHLIAKGFVRRDGPGQWVKEGTWTLTRT
jgi:predicted HTH transcriptional regulator